MFTLTSPVGVGSRVEKKKFSLVLSTATTDDTEIADNGWTRSVEVTISWIWDTNKLVAGAETIVGVGIIVLVAMAPSIELVPIVEVFVTSPISCIVLVGRIDACALVVVGT